MTTGNADVVREMFDSYLKQDRDNAERLVSSDFVFSSPQDDFIDRRVYFERCFPTAERLRKQTLTDVVEISDTDVFVRYEYVLKTGAKHRNTEVISVRDGQITEVQVYFGATLAVAE